MDFTERLSLNKPNPDPVTGDVVDVSKLNENADKIDSSISFTECTSTVRPPAPFTGQAILELDTGRAYVWGGSGWLPLLIGGPNGQQFDSRIGLGTNPSSLANRMLRILSGATGSGSQVRLETTSTPNGNRALSTYSTADTQDRFWVDFDGKLHWGGGSSVDHDVSIARSASGTIDVDGSLTVGGVVAGTPGHLQKFAANGTWTKPTRARRVRVRLVGGGGAGAGSVAASSGQHSKGGGGGGGGYAEKWFDASALPATIAVTIGLGGTGAVGTAQGQAGGTTSFGSLLSASGGLGGFSGLSSTATYVKNGGPGGSTFTGAPDLQVAGCFGLQGGGGVTLGAGGPGGASFWGGGGAGAETSGSGSSVPGGDAIGYGGGGGGAASSSTGAAATGGDGGDGYMIVESYF